MKPLGAEHYLESSTRAAERARQLILALTIASGLVLAAMLNSLSVDWPEHRLQVLQDAHGDYTNLKVGEAPSLPKLPPPTPEESRIKAKDPREHREKRYELFYEAYAHAYIEHKYFVHVPLFGITIDINNLGIFAGAGLSILLLLLQFSLLRELSNLQYSFREAGFGPGKIVGDDPEGARKFYELAAMEQVLTVPKNLKQNDPKGLRFLTKIFYFFPIAVYALLLFFDWFTSDVAVLLDAAREFEVLYCVSSLFVVIITCQTLSILRLAREIDGVWDNIWNIVRPIEEAFDRRNNPTGSPAAEKAANKPSPEYVSPLA